jgi:hypothetical protein
MKLSNTMMKFPESLSQNIVLEHGQEKHTILDRLSAIGSQISVVSPLPIQSNYHTELDLSPLLKPGQANHTVQASQGFPNKHCYVDVSKLSGHLAQPKHNLTYLKHHE